MRSAHSCWALSKSQCMQIFCSTIRACGFDVLSQQCKIVARIAVRFIADDNVALTPSIFLPFYKAVISPHLEYQIIEVF